MSAVVGRKGRVTIEKPIRDALGIGPGWRAIQRTEGKALVIRFVPPKHNRSLAGILRNATTVTIPTSEELDRAIDEAWTMPDPEDE